MKIILVHGDHSEESRKRLDKFKSVAKKRNWDVIRTSGSDKIDFTEQISGGTLFKKKRLFILGQPLSVNVKHLGWLKKNKERLEGNLVIYNDRLLSKAFLSKLPKIDKAEQYDLPKIIFKLLESFYPGNSKTSLLLLHQTLETEPAEFVFALLSRHLKDLYKAKIEPESIVYPSWRKSKLVFQAKRYKKEKIEEIIKSMAEIDVLSKTTDNELVDLLDLLVIINLE